MQTKRPLLFWLLVIVAFGGFLLLIPRVRHSLSFIVAFIREPQRIGSLTPSSRFVTREITKFSFLQSNGPIQVLEVGGGTGVFSDELAKKLRPEDHLDVIELEPKLCTLLEKKLEPYANVDLHCISILDWHPAYRYDVIVSSLPFNVFPAERVQTILAQYQAILAPGGTISYIEYIGGAWVTSLFSNCEERENLNAVQELLAQFRAQFDVERVRVWLNLPPAYVYHLHGSIHPAFPSEMTGTHHDYPLPTSFDMVISE